MLFLPLATRLAGYHGWCRDRGRDVLSLVRRWEWCMLLRLVGCCRVLLSWLVLRNQNFRGTLLGGELVLEIGHGGRMDRWGRVREQRRSKWMRSYSSLARSLRGRRCDRLGRSIDWTVRCWIRTGRRWMRGHPTLQSRSDGL